MGGYEGALNNRDKRGQLRPFIFGEFVKITAPATPLKSGGARERGAGPLKPPGEVL